MPHNVLEYSSDLRPLPDFSDVFAKLHRALEDTAGAQLGNSKSRARSVESYVGDGDPANAMVHLAIRLMEGRPTEVKAALATECLAILRDSFRRAGDGRLLQITVSVVDIDRATYAKFPEGTIPT